MALQQLMMCYNTLWLRMALEIVFGETIPIDDNDDPLSIIKLFLLERVLYNHEIAQKFAHPTVPNSFKSG